MGCEKGGAKEICTWDACVMSWDWGERVCLCWEKAGEGALNLRKVVFERQESVINELIVPAS